MLTRFTCLLFIALVVNISPTVSGATDWSRDDRKKGEELWETAIAAKGGRERLHSIKSFGISYVDTARNFLGLAVHRGIVESLYAFPNKSWAWDDGLPPPFSLSVRVLNLEQDLSCTAFRNNPNPVCGQPKQRGPSPANEYISQVQYLYLMETRWVRPIPYSVTTDKIEGKTVEVLHTRFADKRIDYYLNQKTHLPRRVSVFCGNSSRATLSVDLYDYVNVDGIQMPSKQHKGKINFEVNPPYDETIFTHPPVIAAGPHAWRRIK